MVCGDDHVCQLFPPELINPNDEEHTLERMEKKVSAMDEKTADTLCQVYRAPDIRIAKAAKVIENNQCQIVHRN